MAHIFKQIIQGKPNYWGLINGKFVNRIDDSPSFLFTGLTDKNDNKIFENDNVSDGHIIYTVEYNMNWASFYLNPTKRINESGKSDNIAMNYRKLANGHLKLEHLEIV